MLAQINIVNLSLVLYFATAIRRISLQYEKIKKAVFDALSNALRGLVFNLLNVLTGMFIKRNRHE